MVTFDHKKVIAEATEIVVFGSRAAGVNQPSSDLDVLCFAQKKRKIKSRELDCLCLLEQSTLGLDWLGSELASHISEYGVWIVGRGEWRTSVRISGEAIAQKTRRVAALVGNVKLGWSKLHPEFHLKYKRMIRRELQRLELLRRHTAIPPTPILDARRKALVDSPARLLEVAAAVPNIASLEFVDGLLRDEM